MKNLEIDAILSKDNAEFCKIKNDVDRKEFEKYMEDKDISAIRLPVNNLEAYRYLLWLNSCYCADKGNYLNFLLNLWDISLDNGFHIRPPTPREYAIVNAKLIVKSLADSSLSDKDKGWSIDFQADGIRDAYYYWNYPIWIASGLAGCVLKFGTFEDNAKADDKYITYEEWFKLDS